MDDNVTNVFGTKFLSTLVPFDLCLAAEGQDDPDVLDTNSSNGKDHCALGQGASAPKKPHLLSTMAKRQIWGMVSKAGEGVGRADNDRQFIYLNGRPVDLPKVTALHVLRTA